MGQEFIVTEKETKEQIVKASQEVLSGFSRERPALIPVLQGVQAKLGYLPRQAMLAIAAYLNIAPVDVYGVVTFYNQFRLNPPGKYQVAICRGTACHVKGSFNLLETLQRELGIEAGATTRDGLFSLETVACIGACSIAPVMTVNGEFYGRLDKKKVEKILRELRA
jgi:NADH-quinone oxidoreductase subunit E